jgi:hypothetical protein
MVVKMRKNKTRYYPKFFFLIAATALMFLGLIEGDKRGNSTKKQYTLNKIQTSGKQGDAYRFFINNINMPMNRVGTLAAVNIEQEDPGGGFGNGYFLFSGGFFMSGLTNGNLWAFAQASASLIENMTPGTVESGPNDPDAVIYVVNKEDEPFGPSWQDWKTAVDKFDADFYDGNGDGEYNPVDLNGNEEWDPDEDMPDLLGDETAWCVYTDGQPGAQRTRFAGVNPQGIEVRQTLFGFASKGALGNMLFIRYRIRNSGLVADVLDSVYFGAWSDPDLGVTFNDDLVGVDVPRNAGFTYNGGESPDPAYGTQIPCFMIDFFSGPKAFIPGETFVDSDGDGIYTEGVDTPLDTAYSSRGQNLGIKIFPGAKNLDVSSFVHYIQSDPLRGDPNDEFEARHYMLGTLKLGEDIEPCNDAWGGVFPLPCDDEGLDIRLWYSGDPVTNVGWLNTGLVDQRQMTNVGPFKLVKGEEDDLEIVVAYVVGQGSDRLNSITVARDIDDGAQFIFDGNFKAPTPPPTLQVDVESGAHFIDFLMPVSDQVGFLDKTDAWDNRFEGINVTAYRTNSTQEIVGGTQNIKLYTSYQLDSFIQDIYKENPETGGRDLLYSESSNKLDPQIYSDPATGRIRVRVTNDPFSNGALIKGQEYYFSFTSYALNYDALLPMNADSSFGSFGDYYLSASGFVGEVENIPKIITTTLADDLYNPPTLLQPSNQVSGHSTGSVGYDIIVKDELTTSQYEVSFFKDSSSELYQMYWKMESLTSGELLVDSSLSYLLGEPVVNEIVTEGFITKVEEQNAAIGTLEYEGTQWFTDFYDPEIDAANDGTGATYMARDILQSRPIPTFPGTGEIMTADRIRRIELRFGPTGTGKAYRYINGYLSVFALNSYRYAPGLTPADTVGKGSIGNWDEVNDRPNGWVDVPFTAWIVDDNFGTEEQLAVGFVERARNVQYSNGTPDGVWDPTTDLLASGEIILIFDSPYDPNGGNNPYDPNSGGQIEFTGGAFSTPGGEEFVWADLTKTSGSAKDAPDDATNITEDQRTIFNSKWFNTLYAVGFQRQDEGSFYSDGDVLTIPVTVYPYTEEDVYQFQTETGGGLTEDEERELFNTVNVYPNPLYGFNVATSYTNSPSDEPFVTFSNLPEEITVRIYSLSGQLLRTLTQADKSSPTSPFIRWDLQNESALRVASGLYLAVVNSPKYGVKVLKFSIIMPEKQIQKF